LIAVSLLSCTFLPYYGYEARFYGLYFMLSALILWLWANTGNSAAWIVVFGAVFFLCSAVHSYGVLCLLPYALSDILSRRPWWRPSPKVIAGAVGIVVDAGALFFQVAATRKVSGGFPGPHPSFAGLQQIYAEMFPAGLFLLALIAIWIALFPVTGKSTALPAMQSPERVGWLCLSIPIAGLVLATAVTHAFSPRYFIGMLPGVAVAFACALWRHFNRVPALAFGIFALLGGVGVARQIQVIRHPESIDIYGQQTQTREFLRREGDIWKDGKQFILWSGNFLYLPAHYYSHHQDQYVFLQPDDEGLRALLTIPLGFTQYYPYRVWTTKDLIRHARETAVIHPRPATLKALQDAGFQVEIRYSDPIQIVYLK
jgi:hypothetical protein